MFNSIFIIILIIIFIVLLAAVLLAGRKRLSLKSGVIGIIFLCIAMIAALIGASGGSLCFKTTGSPEESVEAFFSAVLSGDNSTASEYVSGYTSFDIGTQCESSRGQRLQQALRENLTYTLNESEDGDDAKNSLSANRSVTVSYLNLSSLQDYINRRMNTYIEKAAKSYGRNYTADDGSYLPEIYENAYDNILDDVLADVSDYMETVTLDVSLKYTDAKWKILSNSSLTKVLTGAASANVNTLDLSVAGSVENYSNNILLMLQGELPEAKTIYTIPETATVAPAPNSDKYGTLSIDEADKMNDIIDQASWLLDGQDTIFNSDANFYEHSDIEYYCDDSILVICWKEVIDERVCCFSEIKIADASQFRRKLSGDTYQTSVQEYPSTLAASCNPVVAMSADFFGYRPTGSVVYQSTVYRVENSIESLFVKRDGTFLFYQPSWDTTKEELQQYVNDNDILFSLSFGPVLIRDYEPQEIDSTYAYSLGEPLDEYSRAALCYCDNLHYLYVTLGYTDEYDPPRATLEKFRDILTTKNVQYAYTLDGGQTCEIMFNGKTFSHLDYGSERTVSDIIYFATAIPEEENQ